MRGICNALLSCHPTSEVLRFKPHTELTKNIQDCICVMLKVWCLNSHNSPAGFRSVETHCSYQTSVLATPSGGIMLGLCLAGPVFALGSHSRTCAGTGVFSTSESVTGNRPISRKFRLALLTQNTFRPSLFCALASVDITFNSFWGKEFAVLGAAMTGSSYSKEKSCNSWKANK